MRLRTLGLVPVAASAAALSLAATAQAAPIKLVGTVGPGFTITLRNTAGKPVVRLKPGRYTILVRDESPIHNFHLFGPGVNRATSVVKTGRTVWRVVLRRGSYHFQCDPHRAFMRGEFSVR